jgi:hypothetical protein
VNSAGGLTPLVESVDTFFVTILEKETACYKYFKRLYPSMSFCQTKRIVLDIAEQETKIEWIESNKERCCLNPKGEPSLCPRRVEHKKVKSLELSDFV